MIKIRKSNLLKLYNLSKTKIKKVKRKIFKINVYQKSKKSLHVKDSAGKVLEYKINLINYNIIIKDYLQKMKY